MNDITRTMADTLDSIVGDAPVSEQLCIALERTASKNHTHNNYVTRDDFEELSKIVRTLVDLVGDMPISEQIAAALKK